MPESLSSASTTMVAPIPFESISLMAPSTLDPKTTFGTWSSVNMTSFTRMESLSPRLPPGWNLLKSFLSKRLALSSTTDKASPMARAAVVLEVGARPMGQASLSTPTSITTSLSVAMGESRAPVKEIILAPICLSVGKILLISLVWPLFEMARTTSSFVTVPRSPWMASAGCRKREGVPVLFSVAAIFLATNPDFPIPVAITLPLAFKII